MTINKFRSTLLLCVGFLLATVANAQGPRPHPHYMRAIENLRTARWLLENHPGNWAQVHDEKEADREINEALREIKEAAIDDGKNINDHPHMEMARERMGNLRQAMDYVRHAREELTRVEDGNFGHGLRARAIKHCDEAMRFIDQAMHSMH